MTRPDIKADAQRVFEVLKAGGVAICPADVGYAIMTCNPKSLEKVFMTKKRGATKRHAMIGSYDIHKSLHDVSPLHRDIIDHITQDLRLPMGIIGRFKEDHPLLKSFDETTLEQSSVNNTISILTNAGAFQDELTKLTFAENMPIMGSSANLSGTGTKYRVEDIQKEIKDAADIIIDYGLLKWWVHGRSSTMIDFSGEKLEVVRIGACYDIIKDVLKRRWNIELPDDPGMDALRFGHLKTPAPLESLSRLITA